MLYFEDIDLEEDSDSKIAGNAQGKDYLEAADFPLDEELTDGEVMEPDILLEDDDDNEGANEDVDDDEEDEEVVVEEANNDDDEIKEVEEGVEVLKLEDEVENGSVQTEEVNSEDKQDDEVIWLESVCRRLIWFQVKMILT